MYKNRGYFIVVDGLNKAGKSTQIDLCAEELKKLGYYNLLTTKEPTDGPIGKLIQLALHHKNDFHPLELQVLCTADRIWHIKKIIKPELERNAVVLCKRYVYSTIAYGAPDVNPKLLAEINSEMITPDLALFLDVKMEEIERRFLSPELFRKEELSLKKVRDAYQTEFGSGFFLNTIDGNGSIEEVHQRVMNHVLALLGHNTPQMKIFNTAHVPPCMP